MRLEQRPTWWRWSGRKTHRKACRLWPWVEDQQTSQHKLTSLAKPTWPTELCTWNVLHRFMCLNIGPPAVRKDYGVTGVGDMGGWCVSLGEQPAEGCNPVLLPAQVLCLPDGPSCKLCITVPLPWSKHSSFPGVPCSIVKITFPSLALLVWCLITAMEYRAWSTARRKKNWGRWGRGV